jgi:NAD(P)-dependent dehydrogenase (short-subunit alcohol dehydrogenase family)
LGLATAKAFAEAGASVVLADWNEKEVQDAAKDLADETQDTRRPL